MSHRTPLVVLALSLLLVLSACPKTGALWNPGDPIPETWSFEYLPLSSGEVVDETGDMLMDMTIVIQVEDEVVSEQRNYNREKTIVRKTFLSDEGEPRKLEVFVEQDREIQEASEVTEPVASSLEGGTYLLTWDEGGSFTAVSRDGESVSATNSATLEAKFEPDETGTEDLYRLVDGETLTAGQQVEISPEELVRLMESFDGVGAGGDRAITLQFQGLREDEGELLADFALAIAVTGESGGMKLGMVIDGTLTLDALTTRNRLLVATGTMTVDGPVPGPDGTVGNMKGEGALSVDLSKRYSMSRGPQ